MSKSNGVALSVKEQSELIHLERIIEAGLQTFIEVGTALLAIREQGLYKDFGTFEMYCSERWDLGRRRAYQLMDAAEVALNVNYSSHDKPHETHLRPLVPLEPHEQRIVWEVVQQTAPAGKVTTAHTKSVVTLFKEMLVTGAIDDGTGIQIAVSDVAKAALTEETYWRMLRQQEYIATAIERKNGGTPRALQSSENNEWYTPALYIGAVREVLGAIDIDPASNEIANRIVCAKYYYTLADNGFDKSWYGRVFLNPPYGRESGESNQSLWSARLIEQYQRGITTEAILLVNAVTDRTWFQPLWDYSICFTDHRIRFYAPEGEFGQPTHGNVFVYFGSNTERFAEVFKRFGPVVMNTVRKA